MMHVNTDIFLKKQLISVKKNHLISTASSLSQNYSGSCIFSPFALREDAEASLYYYDYKPRAAMVA